MAARNGREKMRDLTTEELSHVYGAGGRGRGRSSCAPHGGRGSKGKHSRKSRKSRKSRSRRYC